MGSDQYITASMKTMAITRKRSQSSAEEDGSSDDQEEDGGPSKKIASKHFNVKSTELLPLPRSGPVLVITMIVHLREREEAMWIQLDTSSTVPLLAQKFA